MTLVIFPGRDQPDAAIFWVDLKTGEEGVATPLSALAARRNGDQKQQICLAVPGDQAMSRDLTLPMKRERDVRRAAHLALEDQLAAPLSDMEIAVGADHQGQRLVSVAAGDHLRTMIEAAQAEGLDPDIVTIDHALLPAPDEGEAVMLTVGGRQLFRSSSAAATFEPGFAELILEGTGTALSSLSIADMVAPETVPNFRRGGLAKRMPLPDLRPYALAASLLLAAGVLFLMSNAVEAMRYASAASKLETQAEARYLETYPGSPIVDLERQLRARSSGPTLQSKFVPLASVLAEVLQEYEDTAVASLSYDPDGELTAEIVFSKFSDLEQVTEALRAQGVAASEGSDARRQEGAYITRLFLRAA
ncbi:MAG: type II secretion system protein GspL [Pseudomonadota bacterium]